MEKNFIELKKQIENAESIVVFSHVNPDGDTLGSNLAISLMIEKYFGKKVDSVFVGNLPDTYSYLPDYERFVDVGKIEKNKVYDLAIAVDVAAKDRMVVAVPIYDNAKFKANIDHHKTNIGYGDLNIIDGDAACVGSILFKIFTAWNYEITTDVARCLYTSLLTDTGNFRYENTTPETFMLAAELVKRGVSPTTEFRACYERKPQELIQFQAHILSNAEFLNNGKIAFAKITLEDMKKFNAAEDYTEGIVEVLRSSKNVEISGILKETKDGFTKVSLRSKNVSVIPIVMDFSGGGHSFAAGCTIKKPLSIAYNKLLERVQSELKCENI